LVNSENALRWPRKSSNRHRQSEVLLVETGRRANLEANHIDLKLNHASKRKPFRKIRIIDLSRSERFMVYYWFLED
jgi:hypothetical protein